MKEQADLAIEAITGVAWAAEGNGDLTLFLNGEYAGRVLMVEPEETWIITRPVNHKMSFKHLEDAKRALLDNNLSGAFDTR